MTIVQDQNQEIAIGNSPVMSSFSLDLIWIPCPICCWGFHSLLLHSVTISWFLLSFMFWKSAGQEAYESSLYLVCPFDIFSWSDWGLGLGEGEVFSHALILCRGVCCQHHYWWGSPWILRESARFLHCEVTVFLFYSWLSSKYNFNTTHCIFFFIMSLKNQFYWGIILYPIKSANCKCTAQCFLRKCRVV